MKIIILLVILLSQSFALAANKPEMVVFASDQGGYPAKSLCFFSNNYMVPHPQGLLVQYTCLGGPDINSELWLINNQPVNIGVSTMGNLFTEPFLRGSDIYFFEYNEFETIALWIYKDGVLTSQKIPAALKDSHVHDLALVGNDFYFRYTKHKVDEHGEGIYTNGFTILPQRGPTFFWKSASNGEIMLQKTLLTSGEAIELRTRANHSPVVILKDRKADPSSPFILLRNQFALRGNRWATITKTDKGFTLIRGVNESYTTEDLSTLFKDIQYWPPAMADDGEIFFRGTDLAGQFALWGYKDGNKRLIIGSNEELDLGGESLITSSKSLLYNPPAIDEKGNLFIGVGLRTPGAIGDVGQGILKF